jgi:peptidoglycan hydrolase-like protein with peptidoglycan-binding domain
MKNGLLISLLTIFIAALALSQSATSPTTSAPTKNSAPKKTAATPVSTKKGKSSKRTVKTNAAFRTRQMAPSADRYRDIQRALVDKGYLKSEPTGVWDAESSEALRQFQTDKQLSPTGKISSATLIGLGLGPKTAAGPEKPDAIATPPAATPEAPPLSRPEN